MEVPDGCKGSPIMEQCSLRQPPTAPTFAGVGIAVDYYAGAIDMGRHQRTDLPKGRMAGAVFVEAEQLQEENTDDARLLESLGARCKGDGRRFLGLVEIPD